MKFKKALLMAPHKIEVVEVDEEPNPDEVLVKVAGCGMCNWELNFWHGDLVWGYPQALGHEYSGEVVKVGEKCTKIKVGDKVCCLNNMGGFAEYVRVWEGNCIKFSKDVDTKYAMGEPQKCIITVMDAADPQPGDYGVIQGCGPMGLWCVQGLSGHYLNGLIAVDIDDEKLALAKKFGATHTVNSKTENAVEKIREITGGHMADFVIDGTGVPALLDSAQDMVKFGQRGKLVMMSTHHGPAPSFDFRKAVDRGLTIIAAHPQYSRNEMDDFRRAVKFIENGTFQNKELVTHEFTLENIQEAFETLANKPAGFKKAIVVPGK